MSKVQRALLIAAWLCAMNAANLLPGSGWNIALRIASVWLLVSTVLFRSGK